MPVVHLGSPEGNLEDYRIIKTKGIILYVVKNIDLEEERLRISLSKLFVWEKLTLEGGKIRK
ncbi:hypothetical protein [Paramaledivibacter caminithermalis]|uniref:Uncharacterized protein n=1 Tax=Paramaledivibacter caminithermalis (strain DSM 15212 / CIP 107654 / DViRD3) TaxID=1121301 RepID=A0A1M6LXE1_PARC5|nr:hypothetical protein [Paramaledivibacter caminithermalis]SHJ75907.1 hypothetical protein SAMN02745912_00964 [Paramaledivibacter caminithermalis DSM 15212]